VSPVLSIKKIDWARFARKHLVFNASLTKVSVFFQSKGPGGACASEGKERY